MDEIELGAEPPPHHVDFNRLLALRPDVDVVSYCENAYDYMKNAKNITVGLGPKQYTLHELLIAIPDLKYYVINTILQSKACEKYRHGILDNMIDAIRYGTDDMLNSDLEQLIKELRNVQ